MYQRDDLVRICLVDKFFDQLAHPLHHPQANANPSTEHSKRNGLITRGLVGQVINQGRPICTLNTATAEMEGVSRTSPHPKGTLFQC